MQFANDITPLTLASTANLRESLNNNTLHSTVRDAFQFELQSRIYGSVADKNEEIKELESHISTLEEEKEDAEADTEIAEKKISKIADLIEGDYDEEDIKEIIG